MRELTDSWLPVPRLGLPRFARAVAAIAARRRGRRLEALFEAVALLRRRSAPPDQRVADAVRAIRSSRGAVPLDALARSLGLTPRSLQRRFADEVGISPKVLARIVRFQRVFAACRDEPGSLAAVAAECGYYDQPHLVRDFREFAGEAPARALVALPEFTALFTARGRAEVSG